MATSDSSALSDRQFKRKVFEELQNAGTIDSLKGTLRSRLVGVLQRRDPGVFVGSGPAPGQQSLWQRAANSLYVEYLAHQNYSYALSVFQPECGLTNQQVMTRDELSRVLCLTPTSSVARFLPPANENENAPRGSPPLLLSILQALADMGSTGARREMQTQTDDYGANSSLALRLQQIDELHERAVETERAAPLKNVEERMAAFQKECETRLRHEMQEQVRRVRDYEVGQARLEEGAKHRRQLADAREELERVHAERLRKLRAREESQMERVRAAEAALERAAYDHRQRLAQEHDKLRDAKEAAAREEGVRALSRAREDEAVARREAELAAKESAWQVRYAELAAEAEERAMARRREAERDAERRIEALMAELGTVADERAKLERDRTHHAAELAAMAKERHRATAAEQRSAAEEERAREHAAAAEMLGLQLEDLRLQLDAARHALEKRGIPLPAAPRAGELPGGGGGIGLALLMGERAASGSSSTSQGPAYAQVVAAMERARAESAVARQEIVRRRKDIARLNKERKRDAHERNLALKEAADWKGKADVASTMLDEAVKKAEEAWETAESAKTAMQEMKVLLEEERGKRVVAEQSAEVFRQAATATYTAVGMSASGLGLETSLNTSSDALGGSATRQRALDATTAERLSAVIGGPSALRNTGSVPPRVGQAAASGDAMPTATKMRLEKLAAQEEKQKVALANFQRRVAYERQSNEAAASMAAANLDAMQRISAARRQSLVSSTKFHAREYLGSGTGLSSHIGVSQSYISDSDSDSADDDTIAAEVKAGIDAQLGAAPSTHDVPAVIPSTTPPSMVRANVDGREVLVPANAVLAWGESSVGAAPASLASAAATSSTAGAIKPETRDPQAVATSAAEAAKASSRSEVLVSGRAVVPAPSSSEHPAAVTTTAAATATDPSPTASPSSSKPTSPTKGSFFGRMFSSKKAAAKLSPVKKSAAEEKAALVAATAEQKLREAEERRVAAEAAFSKAAAEAAERERATAAQAEAQWRSETEKAAAATLAESQRRAEEEKRMKAIAVERQEADAMSALERERKAREETSSKMTAVGPSSAAKTPPRSPIVEGRLSAGSSRAASSRATRSPGVSASGEIDEFVEEEDEYVPDDLDVDDVGFDDDVSVAGGSEIHESISVKSGSGSGDSVF